MRKVFRAGSRVRFIDATDEIKHYMDRKENKYAFLSWDKTYILQSDRNLVFEEGDDGCKNAGWTGIIYDKYTGVCTTPNGETYYATIKLVEDGV